MYVYKVGGGIINSVINKLPFEVHVPGYQYCGPGTKLDKRLARGDSGINPLDAACKLHDIAYEEHKSGEGRIQADKKLSEEAWKRVKSKDARIGERVTALAVTAAMKTKMGLSKFGGGLCKKRKKKVVKKKSKKGRNKRRSKAVKSKKCAAGKKCCTFAGLVKHTKTALKTSRPTDSNEILNSALGAAKRVTKSSKGKISVPRIIPIPKTGGLLSLVPIFAGLSALGTLAGGSSALLRAIGAAKEAKEELKEGRRHNNAMEAIAIGRSHHGEGLYMKPYKTGYGLYLQPYPRSKN